MPHVASNRQREIDRCRWVGETGQKEKPHPFLSFLWVILWPPRAASNRES